LTCRSAAWSSFDGCFDVPLHREARDHDQARLLDGAARRGARTERHDRLGAGPPRDGVRFRGGVALTGGGLFVDGYALGLGGIDGRIGVQINNLIGVYAQPYLTFGGGQVAGATGVTGTVGSDVIVDFTFLDQIFVGAGAGAGIIGSLVAEQAHLRVGGYPVVARGLNGIRRKGLMIGADLSVHFTSGAVIMQPMVSIGYEAF
jgi:hypothetical protein